MYTGVGGYATKQIVAVGILIVLPGISYAQQVQRPQIVSYTPAICSNFYNRIDIRPLQPQFNEPQPQSQPDVLPILRYISDQNQQILMFLMTRQNRYNELIVPQPQQMNCPGFNPNNNNSYNQVARPPVGYQRFTITTRR